MQGQYHALVVDLNDSDYQSLDTAFSISNGVLFLQLVELKEQGKLTQSFQQIATDIKSMIDLNHRDNTLKSEVKNNVAKIYKT